MATKDDVNDVFSDDEVDSDVKTENIVARIDFEAVDIKSTALPVLLMKSIVFVVISVAVDSGVFEDAG